MAIVQPRRTLDNHLKKLNDDILILGSMVEQATLAAVNALKIRDIAAGKRIYKGDSLINAKRFEIETETLMVIATQQPNAIDLRILASVLEVNTELERMGDYAKGIARIAVEMGNHPPLRFIPEIEVMAKMTVNMLHRSLGAFVNRDEATAREIPKEDDQVDILYNKVNRFLIEAVGHDATVMDRANYLMWAAHNLERMADRVTNICERTVFVTTGHLVELDDSDDEMRGKR